MDRYDIEKQGADMWFALMLGAIWVSTLAGMEKFKGSDLIVWALVLTLFAFLGLFVMDGVRQTSEVGHGGAINWFAVTIMVIWISAAVGGLSGNDDDCFAKAFGATLAIGIGYASTRDFVGCDTVPNWYALTTMGLWIIAAADAVRARQAAWYGLVLIANIVLGFIYLIVAFP